MTNIKGLLLGTTLALAAMGAAAAASAATPIYSA